HTRDDIHLFEVREVDRHTIDQWYAIITPLYRSHAPDDTVRVCFDLRIDDVAHLTYAFQKWRAMAAAVEGDLPHARYAVLRPANLNTAMLDGMLSLAPEKPFDLRYFGTGDYRLAVRWLWGMSL
ncbi:MAG: hypothetical protein AAF653_20175, partial [Chloroflexota bacterium]